jgi:hypothetical protein
MDTHKDAQTKPKSQENTTGTNKQTPSVTFDLFNSASSILFITIAIFALFLSVYTLDMFTDKTLLMATSVLVAVVGTLLLNALSYKKSSRSFSEVDQEAKLSKQAEISTKLEELEALLDNMSALKEDSLPKSPDIESFTKGDQDPFSRYIFILSSSINDRVMSLDEKASIMLDKGTQYAKNGIFFFIFSIIGWQLWIYVKGSGISPEHYFGIASCSLLFLFIEFLSAWFMRQYRHFIDTSTYLTKIKSIFDKYMLSYLALKSLSSSKPISDEHIAMILDTLSQEIKWPDSNLVYDKRDISFAREAIESITSITSAYKDLASFKSGKDKPMQ